MKPDRRLRQLALSGEDHAPVIERFDKSGPQTQRLLQMSRRRGEVAARLAEDAEQVPALGVARLLLDELAIGLFGARKVAGLMKAPASRQQVRRLGHESRPLRCPFPTLSEPEA